MFLHIHNTTWYIKFIRCELNTKTSHKFIHCFQVYPIKEGQNWKRRDVIIKDPPTTKKICCKLWNSFANFIKDDDNGSTELLKNMEVDINNERHQLRTTTLSSLTVHNNYNNTDNNITYVCLIRPKKTTHMDLMNSFFGLEKTYTQLDMYVCQCLFVYLWHCLGYISWYLSKRTLKRTETWYKRWPYWQHVIIHVLWKRIHHRDAFFNF